MYCCLILAGGRGKRFKGNKALLKVGGKWVIDIQIEELNPLFEEFLIVTNSEDYGPVNFLEREGVRVIEETVSGQGPLGGILSGLEASRYDKNFVIACDMPFVRRNAVSYVLKRLDGSDCDVCVPQTPKGLEPLFAAYRKTCIPAIKEEIKSGNLKVTGFMHRVVVCEISWEELEIYDPSGAIFMNINTKSELAEAERLLEGSG